MYHLFCIKMSINFKTVQGRVNLSTTYNVNKLNCCTIYSELTKIRGAVLLLDNLYQFKKTVDISFPESQTAGCKLEL